MKKLLLFALLALPSVALADNYFEEGFSWTERVYGTDFETHQSIEFDQHVTIQGDTIIDGVAAKKVYTSSDYKGIERNQLTAIIRVEGDKVYGLTYKETHQWRLAYDFSMQVGDVREIGWFHGYSQLNSPTFKDYIKCVGFYESEDYGGWPIMRFEAYFTEECLPDDYMGTGEWLVGVGNVAGVADNYFTDDVCGGGGRILSLEKDGEVICQYVSDSLEDASASEMAVSVDGLAVSVAGAEAGCEVRAYAANGAMVACAVASEDGRVALSLPAPGLYLISTPAAAAKVLAR